MPSDKQAVARRARGSALVRRGRAVSVRKTISLLLLLYSGIDYKVNFSSTKTAMSGTTQRDADGDVVMSVGQPVFEFIKAPKLEDWSQSAIVKWRKAQTQYESRMRQRCADSGESLAKVLTSIKDSFDVKLLEVVSLYELQTTVDAVTEEQLGELILERTMNVMNEFVPDLDGFFRRNLRMDLTEVDIDARVLKYYRDFSELIEQHGFGRLLAVGLPLDSQFEDRMKLRCKILLDNLEPQLLRDDVQRYVKYECHSAKKNDFELFRIIKERARTQHKYHVLSLEYKQNRSERTTRRPRSRTPRTPRLAGTASSKTAVRSRGWLTVREARVVGLPRHRWMAVCTVAVLTGCVSARQRVKMIGAVPWRNCARNGTDHVSGPRPCALTSASTPRLERCW